MSGICSLTGGGRSLRSIVVVLALLLLVIAPATGDGQAKGKVSKELKDKVASVGSDDLVSVIVSTRGVPSSAHFARLHGRAGQVKKSHKSFDSYTARIPASQIDAFADDPEIEWISNDTPVKAHLDIAREATRAGVALLESGSFNGSGVGVAIIDTGVAQHNDLTKSKNGLVEVDVTGGEKSLTDHYGHGTHVAGIIAGSGEESSDPYSFRTFKGLAPGARLISVRALAADGTGFTSDIIAGIDWVIQNRDLYNIRVLNVSLGHPVYESYATDPLCLAVRAAWEAGIVVVVAAGNDGAVGSGFGTITSPANEPAVITVGAMDDSNTVTTTDDVLAWYSARGPSLIDYVVKPDIVAPGSWIISTRATGSYLDVNYHELTLKADEYKADPGKADKDGVYYELAGTSMAAPMVAAAAALMLQQEPGLNPDSVKLRLMTSASRLEHLIFETGAGYLNVTAAMQAQGYTESAPSPHAVLHKNGTITIEDTTLSWGEDWTQSLIWGGTRIYLFDAVELENNQVTASGLIWGSFGMYGSILSSSTGTVDILGSIWSGKTRR